MTDAEFMQLIDAGIAVLPESVRDRMHNIAVVLADAPSEQQRRELALEANDIIFGLYEGVPQTERGVLEEVMLPDKITIFKNSILAVYAGPTEIATCVANTVWHEVAHHFGMDEATIRSEEIKRKKRL